MMSAIEVTSRTEQSGTAMMREYYAIALRNRWLILACLASSVLLAWMYCVLAPQYYRSETLILAEEQNLLENVGQRSGEGNLEQRIYLIQRRIMSPDFFAPIAKEFNLYPKELQGQEEYHAVENLAKEITVEMLKKDRAGNFMGQNGIEAFIVAFMHKNPQIAMQVTARIAAQFVEENTKEREKSAESTSEFLDDETRALKLELEKKEEQISRFKSAHIGELPQQTEANLRTLDRLQSDITSVNEGIQRQADRVAMVEKAIQEYRLYGRQNPAYITRSIEPDPLFRQLNELR